MRLKTSKANLMAVIAVCLWVCAPLTAQNKAFAGRSALGSPPVASKDRVFVGRAEPAQKVTVVAGEGHFPVACMLKNGEIAVVLRGGAPHIGIKGRLDLVTSQDGGQTWSAPRTIVDTPFDDRNPAFGQLSDGALVLAYVVVKGGFDETGLRMKEGATENIDGVFVIRSTDAGNSWTSPYKIDMAGMNGFSPFGKIIQLADGTALMAIYLNPGKSATGASYLYRSRDNGKTWGDPSRIAVGYDETGLVSLPDGRLLAALRADKGGHMAMAYSRDQGRTWSEPRLLTQDAEMPGDLIVLRDGSLVFTYGERNHPCGVHALVSHDGGNSWDENHLVIVADDAPNWDTGYPSSVELNDGRVFTVYYKTETAYDPTLPTEVLARTLLGAKARGVIWRVPYQKCDFAAANDFIAGEAKKRPGTRALMVVHPTMTADDVEKSVLRHRFVGFKPYLWYAPVENMWDARIPDFMPEHQLAVANRFGLIIGLHLSKKRAIADPENLNDLEHLTEKYPRVRWILYHNARSYDSWAIEEAAPRLRRIHNVWIEGSSVCESAAFDATFSNVPISRVMYGTDDFPVGITRGKYTTWGHAWAQIDRSNQTAQVGHCDGRLTFVRYEMLCAMRRAAKNQRLTRLQIEDVLYNNAERLVNSAWKDLNDTIGS